MGTTTNTTGTTKVRGIIWRNAAGIAACDDWHGSFRAHEETFDCTKVIIADFIEYGDFQEMDLTHDMKYADVIVKDQMYESYEELDPSSESAQYWIKKFKGIGEYNADNQFDQYPEHEHDKYYDHKQVIGISKSGERFEIWNQYAIINRFDPNTSNPEVNKKYGYWD